MATEQAQASPPPSDPGTDRTPDGERPAYLAFVAHEMRNPLSTALWSAELLARMSPEERGGARGEKLSGMCLRTLTRLRHLVEDHFLAERLAIRGIPVRAEPIAVADVLRVAATRSGVPVADAGVDGVVVNADRAMLERGLEAMLAAAARGGATVRVGVTSSGDRTAVVVRGAPPPPDAFRRPDRSTASDPSGRALGLLAAQAVAEAHGGALDLIDDGYALLLPAEAAADAGSAR